MSKANDVAIQSTNAAPPCHAELVSASIQHCVLPVSLDRARNRLARLAKNGTAKSVVFALCLRSLAQFGMTVAEPVPQLNPSENSTKKSTIHCHCERSQTAWQSTGGRAGLLFGWSLKSHVQPLWMALSAFTMAEILLSLTIIGIVAAITLPSLTGNINERTWNTQRKALYARMSQAIALMPALNGYGTLTEDESGNVTEDTAAETFTTAGLSKVLKINNICDREHLEDCLYNKNPRFKPRVYHIRSFDLCHL